LSFTFGIILIANNLTPFYEIRINLKILNLIKEKTQKSTPLIAFISIFTIGLVVAFFSGEFKFSNFPHSNFWWNIYGAVDTSSAVAVAFLAFFGYVNYIKLEDKIKILFKSKETNEVVDLNLSILRKNFTRSEIVGILGMIQKNNKERFEIKYLKQREILDKIHKIQKGNNKEFIIEVTQNELKQFILN